MRLQSGNKFLTLGMFAVVLLCACQAEDTDNTLLSQMQELEAQESAILFTKAITAAENDNVGEAKSLIQLALGRGAGSEGLEDASLAIEQAEKRIAARISEQKRLADQKREATRREEEAQRQSNNSGSSTSSYSRPSGLKRVDGVTTGTMSLDTYNAYCMDGTYTSVTVSYTLSKSDPVICASNSYKSSKCRNSSDWSVRDAGQYGCER